MSAIPGIVFWKNGPFGVHFGIDFGNTQVWFWHMNKYISYNNGSDYFIAGSDDDWHFLSATFVWFDIHSVTNMYAYFDTTYLGTYQFVEIMNDDPAGAYDIIVGQKLYGYIRQIRI